MTTGTGTLLLTTAKGYTGNTTVGAGTLKDGVINGVPAASPLILGSGSSSGVFDLGGFAQTLTANISTSGTGTNNAVTNSGAAAVLTNDATGTATWSAPITGNLSLSKTGTGTLTLSGQNTYTGGTNNNAGILVIASSSIVTGGVLVSGPVGTGLLTNSATIIDNGAAQTIANAFSESNDKTILSTATGSLIFDPSGLTTPNTFALPGGGFGWYLGNSTQDCHITINDVITGAPGFYWGLHGTLSLGGANTFSGFAGSNWTNNTSGTNNTIILTSGTVGSPGNITSGPLGTDASPAPYYTTIIVNATGSSNFKEDYNFIQNGSTSLVKTGTGTVTLTGAALTPATRRSRQAPSWLEPMPRWRLTAPWAIRLTRCCSVTRPVPPTRPCSSAAPSR